MHPSRCGRAATNEWRLARCIKQTVKGLIYMATINEAGDSTINAGAHGSYSILEGDTFNGHLGTGDTEDGINLQGLTVGETYTVSVTVDDIAGGTALVLINHFNFHSINYYIADGAPVNIEAGTGWTRDFVETSALRIEGNTISFDFTPLQHTSLAFQVQGDAVSESYSVSFATTVLENIIDGTAVADKINGTEGIDIMSGLDGNDQLDGKDGDDLIDGGAGKDKLSGGLGDDTLNGGVDNDLLEGGAGNDLLDGGHKNDRLHGGDGADILIGDHGNDKLFGDDGDDILNGGIGKDQLTGGAGADSFVFENGSHRDTITDYSDGEDLLDFSGYFGVNSIADLSITQNGADAVISAGGPDSVTLLNTDMLVLDETDFIF